MGEQHHKDRTRLVKQLRAITSGSPRLQRAVEKLVENRMRWLRIPAGVLLILGGVGAVLPLLGAWMLPLGVILLAIDIPAMRRPVSRAITRTHRWWRRMRRKRG